MEKIANDFQVSYVDLEQVTGALYWDDQKRLGFVVIFDGATDHTKNLAKSQKTKLYDRDTYSLGDNRFAFGVDKRWIVVSSKQLLQQALQAKSDKRSVLRKHPAFAAPLAQNWMRMSLSVPQLVRPIITEPQVQLMRTMISSLRRAELFVGQKTLLRLECIDALGADRAHMFLLGLGRLTQGLTGLVRSSILGFLALDPAFTSLTDTLQMLLSQRPLLIRTIVQQFGPNASLAQVSREQRRIEMHIGQGLGKRLIASVAIVAALTLPAYLRYTEIIKQAQTRKTLQHVSRALRTYRIAFGRLPNQALGLQALVKNRLLVDLPQDAWSRGLIYELISEQTCRVRSMGRDGEPGGAGLDLDLEVTVD